MFVMYARPWRQPVGGRGDPRGQYANQHRQQQQGNNGNHPGPQVPPAQQQQQGNNNNNNGKPARQQQPLDLSHEIRRICHQLSENDPTRKSYECLLLHDEWPCRFVNEDWKPFRNLLCFMLYIGWEDKALGMTTQMLDWILNLMLTMQSYNYIDKEFFIPKDHSTILKYKRWFPDPPIC